MRIGNIPRTLLLFYVITIICLSMRPGMASGQSAIRGYNFEPLSLDNISELTLLAEFQSDVEFTEILVSPTSDVVALFGIVSDRAKLWHINDGSECELGSQSNAIGHLVFSKDGTLVALSTYDETIELWNVANCEMLFSIDRQEWSVLDIAFSPDGNSLASANSSRSQTRANEGVYLWDTETGRQANFLPQRDPLQLVFSPQANSLAVASGDGTINLWDITSSIEPVQTLLSAPTDIPVWRMMFSRDGRILAAEGLIDRLTFYEISSRTIISELDGELLEADYGNIAIQEISGGAIQLINIATNTELGMFTLGEGGVIRSFSAEETIMASIYSDPSFTHSYILFWDIASGSQVATIEQPDVLDVLFSPDNRFVISSNSGGRIALWGVPSID